MVFKELINELNKKYKEELSEFNEACEKHGFHRVDKRLKDNLEKHEHIIAVLSAHLNYQKTNEFKEDCEDKSEVGRVKYFQNCVLACLVNSPFRTIPEFTAYQKVYHLFSIILGKFEHEENFSLKEKSKYLVNYIY